MVFKKLALLLTFGLAAGGLHAQESVTTHAVPEQSVTTRALASPEAETARQLKLERMLVQMNIDEIHRLGIVACIEDALRSPNAPDVFAGTQGAYYGFTPDMPVWPEVRAAYRRYAERSCAYMTRDEFRAMYLDFYGRRADDEALDTWLAFMSSEAGRRFLRLQDEFLRESNANLLARYQANSAAAQQGLIQDLRGLAAPARP